MCSRQYQIQFPDVEEDIYIDQAAAGGLVYSAYTPHGIKQIDTDYCFLIRNIQHEAELFAVDRRKAHDGMRYETYHDRLKIWADALMGHGLFIKWSNGETRHLRHGISRPNLLFDEDTKKVDAAKLRESIFSNEHLHVRIKENLISNLDFLWEKLQKG